MTIIKIPPPQSNLSRSPLIIDFYGFQFEAFWIPFILCSIWVLAIIIRGFIDRAKDKTKSLGG